MIFLAGIPHAVHVIAQLPDLCFEPLPGASLALVRLDAAEKFVFLGVARGGNWLG